MTAATAAERQRKRRQNQGRQGLVRRELWVPASLVPEWDMIATLFCNPAYRPVSISFQDRETGRLRSESVKS